MIGRLNHVAIAVPDLDAAAAQYRDALGATVGNPQDEPDHGVTVIFIELPNTKIEVLGPPPTSGTRDAFNELAIEGGCKTFDWIAAIKKEDKSKYKSICRSIREDGAYVEAGENDNLIVQKLGSNPQALGVFGYSFLDQNRGKVQAATIEGVGPQMETIASGDYPVSRSLFFYVKKAHVGVVPGIEGYIKEFTSERAWGPDGYLVDKGMIPLPDDMRAKMAKQAQSLKSMTGKEL